MGDVIPFGAGYCYLAECAGCGGRSWFVEVDPSQSGAVQGVICANDECDVYVPLIGAVIDMLAEH